MRRFQQIAPGVGLLLFGFATAAAVIQGCKPGTICDNPEYQGPCEMPTGGTSGSGGGGTGGGGTGGRDGGGMEAMAPAASTPVPDCPTEYNTLGKMDNFFAMRCGHENACHAMTGGNVWSDMKMPNVSGRFFNTPTKNVCLSQAAADRRMLNADDWQAGMMLVKTRDAMPKCKNGMTAGTIMPPPEAMQAAAMKQPPLTDAEKKCLESWIRVASGK
jgi:hypothetical protein